MRMILSILTLLLVGSSGAKQIEVARPAQASSPERAARVKTAFTTAFDAYALRCYGQDELMPVLGRCSNSRNGWGATVIDAMPVMRIMNLSTHYDQALVHVKNTSFATSRSDDPIVSVFESTIRYIGGMLSAYELGGMRDEVLVTRSKELADLLELAWDQDVTIPWQQVDSKNRQPNRDNAETTLADAGSLIIEMGRLSIYSGDQRYVQLATKTMMALREGPQVLPGMPGLRIDVAHQIQNDTLVTWGGGSDSYFEYLLKDDLLTGQQVYSDAWNIAVESSLRVLRETSTRGNVYLADMYKGRLSSQASHLKSFAGGNLILGGRHFANETIFQAGLDLTRASWQSYNSTATGIGPESYSYVPQNAHNSSVPADQKDFFEAHGIAMLAADYYLRPETIESLFYAWRTTGDTLYQDQVWEIFLSLEAHYRTPAGAFFGRIDVNDVDSPLLDDTQESFFFAETLLYTYLTFSDDVSLDEWVFNTEGHPFRRVLA